MIKPIQNSISFQGYGMKEFQAQTAGKKVTEPDNTPASIKSAEVEQPKKRLSFKERLASIAKGFNKVTNTTFGVARGIVDGAIFAGIIGFAGRNIKKANGDIGKTIVGMFKDTGKIIARTFKHRPITSLITKSPLENIKTLGSLPKVFYQKCVKGNKATGALAAIVFASAVVLRTLQGKINANKANANVDHNLGLNH